ncbi:MAG: alpha-L-arabinofuranosidase C-terminal domain-containing protein [Candidatus Ornithomonoglobus sp.]
MKLKRLLCAVLSSAVMAPAVPVLAQPDNAADEEDTAYLFAYFRDNREEALCYGVSRDGYNFRALNGGEPTFTSTLGTKHLRDPFIYEGPDGYFYIVVTDMNSAKGWASQSTIAIYKTKDLINIDDEILIDYKNFDGFADCNRAWAPQIIWCPEHDNGDGTKGAYMIYLAIMNASTAGELGTIMYKHFATDLMDADTYTEPEFMLTGEENGDYRAAGAIDGDIIYDEINDRYLMYFDGVRVAACETIDGTYTELSEDGEGIYQGASPFTSYRSEGSNIFKLNNEDKWIYCADGDAFGTGYLVFETTDFVNYKQIGGRGAEEVLIDYDFTPRHGYVIPISESELQKLFDEYGYIDLSNKFSDNPLDGLKLPYTDYGYKISGNITLPEELDGNVIVWQSSDESVISTEQKEFTAEEKAEYGENYTSIPAGVVNRPNEDTKIILTASIEADGVTYSKEYPVTVKAKSEKTYKEMEEDGDFKAYLYASFIEPAVSRNYQQTFFAVSDDGLNWFDINYNKAVLTSSMGTYGLRDHYLVRSPEGDKFYLLATDLDATSGRWGDFSTNGSKSLMIWESDDLVHWSKQRMVQIADDNTGCAWAPETIYDELTGEYIVYWSGHDINESSESYGKKVVYYSKTRDFYSFTPQKRFVIPAETDGTEVGTSDSFIDTSMIEGSDGKFYRVTKYEDVSPTRVFMDVADHPLGAFTRANTNLGNNTFLGTEGPGWFKFNKDDAEKLGAKYCLMLDGYRAPNAGVGFFPNTIDDLNGQEQFDFTRVTSGFKMRSYAKHGGIIPITQDEYNALTEAYPISQAVDLSEYINANNKVFDIAQSYPNYPDGWTLPSDKSLDNDTYHYLGINGGMTMGGGYGAGREWTAIQFDMASNSGGDNIIRDIAGNAIIGYCYAPGSDGFWVGHGERSFGGTVRDAYGVSRLPNYLKTEVSDGSDKDNTGHRTYTQHEICTIIIKNETGTVDSYTGDYYTVETYIGGVPVSTEYYSGHRNGVGAIESNNKQYYGQLSIYSKPEKRPDIDAENEHLIFAVDFNDKSTNALKGKATGCGNIEYAAGDDGSQAAVLDGSTAYISAANTDGTPLLRGMDKAVITMRAKLEKGATNGWYFYTAWNDAAQSNRSRSYTGILCGSDGKTVAERYRNNSGTPTITANTSFDRWHEITYIIDNYTAELYIDGTYAGSADYAASGEDHTLSTILGNGDNIVTYFGKANWGSGEYAKGMFDDIAVYDFGPSIQLGDLSDVKEDLALPTAIEDADGYTITWESSDPDVISETGKVTRPSDGKKDVTLTATITFGNTVLTRRFDAVVRGTNYYDLKLNISENKGVDIQDNMYGLFFEDINYAADGGLYAEMIENRSFEQISTTVSKGKEVAENPGYAWSAVNGTMDYKKDSPLNEKNPTYLEFTGSSFKNQAYRGMYIEKDKKYKVSFYAKASGYNGAVSVKTEKNGVTGFEGIIADSVTDKWTKYEKELTAQNSVRYSDFIVELSNEGKVDFDMISVMPSDALSGVFRRDLAEKLKAINPGFLRFPGGCVVEGYDLTDRYQWKSSVGPVEERVQNWNRWAADTAYPNYNQTLGLGFYEYFELCEYLGCDPLPVLSVGIPCEYQGGRYGSAVEMYNEDGSYTEEFYEYIQDALDLVEFANGDTTTKWGSLRAEMGHSEPFNLTMIGIGNEQWVIGDNKWFERYEAFEKEIHKVYPDIRLISTSGPSASGTGFDTAWNWIREKQAENSSFTYAVDEHYYMSPQWFLENDTRYDNYDRGTKVFAGEYAAHSSLSNDAVKKNNLESAIAEAAYMTGLERNADVVYMASYAPLLSRIGYNQWAPDLIWFDDMVSYATPNYYVQSMYSNNNGDFTLRTSAVTGMDKIYQTVSYDKESGDIIVKLVNPYENDLRTSISVSDAFKLSGTAAQEILTGESKADVNSISDPDNISPVKSDISFVNGGDYTVPSNTFAVLRIHTSGEIEDRLISVTRFEVNEDSIIYELTGGDSFDSELYDVYTVVYDEDGALMQVSKNAMSETVTINPDKNYIVKFMVWEKDKMNPAQAVIEKVIN